VLEFTAYVTDYEVATTKTATFTYSLTNTCAGVVLAGTTVYENDVATTDVLYENGQEDVTLTFDAFTQDIAFCPVIYTVHLLTAVGETEVTWNREDNPLVESTYGYDAVADTVFSANSKSSEYLTISRPENGGRGTITISNTGDLDTFVGSYFLELRAQHQDVTITERLTHVGFNCDITIGYNTATAITHYLSTADTEQDLSLSLASENCPAPATSSITCTDNQAWCDANLSFEPSTGILTVSGAIADGVVGTVDVSLTINEGEPNAVTTALTLDLVDPCEDFATVTLTQPSDWPTSIWITDAVTFAIDAATELSHVTAPVGADCGGYTVVFALTDSDGVTANAIYVDVTTADEITVNFLDTVS